MKAIFFLACLAAPSSLFAGSIRMKLTEAIKQNKVRIEAVNKIGAYQGKTTTLDLTNLDSKNTLVVTVDIGTILKPDTESYQPMVLANGELIVIQPAGNIQKEVETFCGAHEKRCPSRGRRYIFDRLASDTLVTVLEFVKQNNLYDDLGQTAVWATTGNYNLSYIHSEDRPEIAQKLQALVSKVTGKPIPDYKTVSSPLEQIPDAPAWTPKPLLITATFRQILEEPQTLSLAIYNTEGNAIQTVFEHKEFPRNGHIFDVQFEAADVPPGYYYIRLTNNIGVLQEKKVLVE